MTYVIQSYEQATEFLFGRINYERTQAIPGNFKLDRMYRLVELLGNPHAGLPVVHIAGTKGKGSTARLTAEVLRAANYRVGLYTSPHLARVEERIWLDGAVCSEDEFTQLTDGVSGAVHQMDSESEGAAGRPTYFEIVTAMAIKHFNMSNVDLAVIEVGLGGRLDSTNVCQPVCCAVTSISLDHTKQLGDNVKSIAAEKAGIIKPGVPVVSGVLDPTAAQVIAGVADERGAPLIQLGRDFRTSTVGSPALDNEGIPRSAFRCEMESNDWIQALPELRMRLLGQHQQFNAATAVTICSVLQDAGWQIPPAAVVEGVGSARLPARIELVRTRPPVILDAAHNEASIKALINTIDAHWPRLPRTVIFGATRGKQIKPMLALLAAWAHRLILTPYLTNPRSCGLDELVDIAKQVQSRAQIMQAHTPLDAWALANRGPTEQVVCITGSFFLAGELLEVTEAVRNT